MTTRTIWQHAHRLNELQETLQGEDHLQKPVKYSAELAQVFGAPTRTARRAHLQHVVVTAGGVARLRDGSMVAVCAPVQLDGKSDISVVAWRLEHC